MKHSSGEGHNMSTYTDWIEKQVLVKEAWTEKSTTPPSIRP